MRASYVEVIRMHPLQFALIAPLFMAIDSDTPVGFSCVGKLEESAPSVRFSIVVGFGLDGALTIIGPDGRPKLDYWNDVAPGEMAMQDSEEEPMVWTGVSSKRAKLVGFGVRSDGSLFALTIASSRGSVRPFSLFDSRSGEVLTGECR
jgi:hypothetical protein